MPRVRVFLCTYRRPHLLQRALKSLLAQTYGDWICEVRNDAPDDDAPAAIVREARDPRLHYVHHPRNLGGVALFNEVFRAQPEPYVALLEDDNWWYPEFLTRMVDAMDRNPDVTLAWSNQDIWMESDKGEWSDTGASVRPPSPCRAPIRFDWPHPRQCFGALHANGAMLLRTGPGRAFPTPRMEFGGTEGVRERSLPHPLLYVPESLAEFSVTQTTHRSKNAAIWATNQVLLAATFLKHAKVDHAFWAQLWADARRASPRMTGTLILAALQEPALRPHLIHAEKGDWWHLALHGSRRPLILWRLLRARWRAPEMWAFLDFNTAARARESAAGGPRHYRAEFLPP